MEVRFGTWAAGIFHDSLLVCPSHLLTRVAQFVCLLPWMIQKISVAVTAIIVPHSLWSQHSHPVFPTFLSSSLFSSLFPLGVLLLALACWQPDSRYHVQLSPPLNFASTQLAEASNRDRDFYLSLKLLLKKHMPKFSRNHVLKSPPSQPSPLHLHPVLLNPSWHNLISLTNNSK